MVRDDFWRIDGGPTADFAPCPIDGHQGPEATLTPGESYELAIWLSAASDSPAGAWPDHGERHDTLMRYGLGAGEFALSKPGGGGIRFVETYSGGAASTPELGDVPGESLLIALRPPVDCPIARGMWALVASVEDRRMLPKLGELGMELVHLARLDAFVDSSGNPDFAGCRDALERRGI